MSSLCPLACHPDSALQAYAYALIKVEDEEGVRAFHSLIGSVLDELSLHTSYATKWGVDVHNVSTTAE